MNLIGLSVQDLEFAVQVFGVWCLVSDFIRVWASGLGVYGLVVGVHGTRLNYGSVQGWRLGFRVQRMQRFG